MRPWPIFAICLILVSRPGAAEQLPPAWETDRRTGCRVWVPIRFPDRVLTWSGACKDGLGEGPGIVVWLSDGNPNGRTQADRFEGTLRNGKAEGPGTLYWPSPQVYIGEFHDGLPNGKGKMVYPGGGALEGEFRDGEFTGHGVTHPEDDVSHLGKYLEYDQHGRIIVLFPNGDRIEIDLSRPGPHVPGTIKMANGARFEGLFDESYYPERRDANGPGKLTLRSGKVYRGNWVNGCLTIGARQIAIDGKIGRCE